MSVHKVAQCDSQGEPLAVIVILGQVCLIVEIVRIPLNMISSSGDLTILFGLDPALKIRRHAHSPRYVASCRNG